MLYIHIYIHRERERVRVRERERECTGEVVGGESGQTDGDSLDLRWLGIPPLRGSKG